MRLAIVARSTENGIFTVFENVPEKSDQLDKKKIKTLRSVSLRFS